MSFVGLSMMADWADARSDICRGGDPLLKNALRGLLKIIFLKLILGE